MNPADWRRVKELFDAALTVPAAKRETFLKSQDSGAEVLAEVRSLLLVYEGSPEFLEGAAPRLEAAEAHAFEGRRIGPWRLLREIGHGGMGVVWEAARDDQEYQQRAAIKLLSIGLLSSADVARFREERQILAGLNHPGIARLLDGGTAEDGSPYLVMEFIEGERLDRWAEKPSLSLRDRLRLFLSICTAVDYAHRRLVVHRDLKPANILVTTDGSAKLLDFGIARLIDGNGLARREATATARRLTPEYASPEQIRGEPVSTATDIYSLGVVLYRLLTGKAPYPANSDDTLAMVRAICEDEPPPPSSVAGAASGEIRGELDAIVLQALRKNPESRYTSVRALADDITAWLEGRPVSAHELPWWHRSWRHIRRHKTQSTAVAAVLATIMAGSAISLRYARYADRERRIAELRFQEGRRLAHTVVFDLHEAIAHLPGSTAARQLLVDRALRYLRELEASGPANRDLQIELAAAYARIGDVLGRPNNAHLGNTRRAIASEREARRLAQAVLQSNRNDTEAEAVLADADERLTELGELQGESAEVPKLWAEELAIRRKQAARNQGDFALMARVREMEAAGFRRRQKWNEAVAAYRQAGDLYREALRKNPGDLASGNRLSTTYHEAAHCWKELNRLDEALSAYREAQRLDQARLSLAPADTEAQADFSFDLLESGWIEYRLGRFQAAIADYEQALAIQERLSAADPQDIRMRLEAAKLLNTAAPAYEAAGYRAKAIQALRTSGERLETALAADPDNQDTRLHVCWVWSNLGGVYEHAAEAARPEDRRPYWMNAEWCYRRSLDALGRLKGSGRPDLDLDPSRMLASVQKGLKNCREQLEK